MRKYKKSTWLPVALFIYTTIMAVYFIPRNTEIGNAEKYVTIGVSYLIIALLWIVLRKQERTGRSEYGEQKIEYLLKRQLYEEIFSQLGDVGSNNIGCTCTI